MSSELLIESFCYGNIKLFEDNYKINYENVTILEQLLEKVKTDIKGRDINSLWCIIHNLQNNIDVRNKNFFRLVAHVFEQFDKHFKSDYTKVSFDNILTLKCFLLNDINYIIDAYNISDFPVNESIVKYYTEKFMKELEYINKFGLVTRYNIPSNKWNPEWTINYNQNTLKTSNIDICLDHMISNPCIVYASNMNNILKKMITRLAFLKIKCPIYYEYIETYIPEFSEYVLNNYPYYEVANNYEHLVKLSDKTTVPDNIVRDDFEGLIVILYIIPLSLSSYILGFPCITMGSLSQKLTIKYAREVSEDKKRYFSNIENKNKQLLETRMFVDNSGNGIEDGDVIDLMYKPIKSYNIDDISTIMSNGVYFSFTYPEFSTLWNTESNPYNREKIPHNFINHIRTYTDNKNAIISECSYRGLKIKLDGTMEENFDELIENIKIFNPHWYENNSYSERSNLLQSIFSGILRGNF